MLALATLAACDGGGHFVSTRLQTTYRHRFQFVSARVELVRVGADEPERTRDVTFPADAATDVELLTGRTLADFEGVPTGTYDVRVTLLDALGRAVDSGSTRVPIDANRSVLVGVSEACGLLSCPTGSDPPDATACSFGRCVAPSCFEDEDGCVEPECASDAECEGTSACTVGRCVGELCVAVPEDSLCPADAFCAGTEGCVTRPVEPTMDVGPADSDAGPLDSGVDSGTCTPSGCEDGDLCTAHACVDGACVTSPLCGGGDYCVAGACHPEPTFALQTSGAPGCIDLGVPHVSPDFAYRRVITGRAGRTAVQTNQQVSCAGDPPQDDPMVFPLGPSGRWEDTPFLPEAPDVRTPQQHRRDGLLQLSMRQRRHVHAGADLLPAVPGLQRDRVLLREQSLRSEPDDPHRHRQRPWLRGSRGAALEPARDRRAHQRPPQRHEHAGERARQLRRARERRRGAHARRLGRRGRSARADRRALLRRLRDLRPLAHPGASGRAALRAGGGRLLQLRMHGHRDLRGRPHGVRALITPRRLRANGCGSSG